MFYYRMEIAPIHFLYTYNCGGLAYMIKGSSTVWFIAKRSNRPFKFSFQHTELNHIFPSNVFHSNTHEGRVIQMIDSKDSKNVIDVAKKYKHIPLYILSNTSLDFLINSQIIPKKSNHIYNLFILHTYLLKNQ